MMNCEMPMHEGRELPTIYGIRDIDFPEIAHLEVGDQKYIVMKVEVTAKRSGKNMNMHDRNDQRKIEGDLQIHSIRILDSKPIDVKTMEKKEMDKMYEHVMSGGK